MAASGSDAAEAVPRGGLSPRRAEPRGETVQPGRPGEVLASTTVASLTGRVQGSASLLKQVAAGSADDDGAGTKLSASELDRQED